MGKFRQFLTELSTRDTSIFPCRTLTSQSQWIFHPLIVLGFNMSTLVGHFVSSPREKEKRDSRGDERGGQERKRNRNKSKETGEIKTFPLYHYLLQR